VRPLLDVTRDETGAYCLRHGIPFRPDASNLSTAYTRNRIREELLPQLESYYNPEARSALLRLSELAVEDTAVLRELSEEAVERATLNIDAGSVVLSIEVLKNLPLALRRRVVRLAIERVRGSLENIEFAIVERALALVEAPGTGFELPEGRTSILRKHETLEISTRPLSMSRRPIACELTVPGETRVDAWRAVFRVQRCEPPVSLMTARNSSFIYLEESALKLPLTVRSRRPGDRYQPFGLEGSQKVHDLLIDRKVPVDLRDEVPILEDAEGILWVVGHGVSERTRTASKESQLLHLEVCYDEAQS
jgi:tRNA(Ile)-lysidine synthase